MLSHAKVSKLDFTIWTHKYVCSFDISVDSVPPMQVGKTGKNLPSVITNHGFLKRAIFS